MAVVAHELAFLGSTGSRSLDGKSQFEAIYRVRTNNAHDQADTVIEYFRALHDADSSSPYLGSTYAYANDVNDTVVCTRIAPRRPQGSRTTWEVTFTYESSAEETNSLGLDENGNPTTDPLQVRPEITMTFNRQTRPVWKAIYRGGFVGVAAAKTRVGREMTPTNSTLSCVLDPPLEKDWSRAGVRVTRYSDRFDGSRALLDIDTVNDKPFAVRYLGFTMTVQKYWAKIDAIEPVIERHTVERNGTKTTLDFWRISKSFEIDRDGWRQEVPDMGLHARADIGDPDGRGGTIYDSDVVAGQPRVRRLVDNDELPINEKVLFDGDGQPIRPGADTVWITWQTYDEQDFRTDPFFQGVLV